MQLAPPFVQAAGFVPVRSKHRRSQNRSFTLRRMHPVSLLSNGFFLSLSLCLDIGIVNVAILSRTLSHGFKPGFWLGLGSCIGDLVYATLALAGMAALLRFEAVRWVVWIGGAAMLLFLAGKWRKKRPRRPPARSMMHRRAMRAPRAASRAASCWRCPRPRPFSGSRP
jgi:threonine/homoserine/homoserine lactone efflux protein